MRLQATYVLPIRHDGPSAELTEYLAALSAVCDVIVVDGSDPLAFTHAHRCWSSFTRHVTPGPRFSCANGKVAGVLTGLDLASTDIVVIADDDVRYSPGALAEAVDAAQHADVVCPQNYFDPLPWHARWDTARTLLNRALGHDFPGTLVVRREALERSGGYDGDVLFENLELMRTVRAVGGRVVSAPGLHVRRLPPTTPHFVGQRVRQAYDEFARPHRLAAQLAVVPFVVAGLRRPARLLAASVVSVGLAEAGRRRSGGRAVFPWTSSMLAPFWLMERGVGAWAAVYHRLRGGVPYGRGRIVSAATPHRVLRRRHAAARAAYERPWCTPLRSPRPSDVEGNQWGNCSHEPRSTSC